MGTFNKYRIAVYTGPNADIQFTYHGPDFPHGEHLQQLLLQDHAYLTDFEYDLTCMDLYNFDPDNEREDLRTYKNEANERVYMMDSQPLNDENIDDDATREEESEYYMITIIKEEA